MGHPVAPAPPGRPGRTGVGVDVGVGVGVGVGSASQEEQWEAHCRGWKVIDDAFMAYLGAHDEVPDRWLLIQTLATAASRRRLLATLGVRSGWRLLDIGTGFGPVPMELAVTAAVDALGVDIAEPALRVADAVCVEAARRGAFPPDSRVTFVTGDAYELEEPDASFDLATARFLFQHLRDHAAAASELARVVKPGGLACVIDVDEGLSVTYPERSAAYSRLAEALHDMQERRGGGRRVARTLPACLDRAGFDVSGVLLIPETDYRPSRPNDPHRTFLLERFGAARAALVGEFIPADEFDDCLGRFATETIDAECVLGGHVAVIGRRRH